MNATFGEETKELAISSSGQDAAGVMALAYMPKADFESRLKAMKDGMARVRRIQKDLMVEDEDYGVIPGTKKPTLLKPGAERLCSFYGFVPTFEQKVIIGDGISQPGVRVETKCRLHLGSTDGPVVGEGVGTCNSFERRYRYRRGERSCPQCGKEGTILKSKNNRGEWFCWAKKGGCGMNFAAGSEQAQAIENQEVGDIINPDPYDQENTYVKISAKRAYIDGTLRATATSGLFTQDLEDMHRQRGQDHDQEPPEERKPEVKKPPTIRMAQIDELDELIRTRTRSKSWTEALKHFGITPPARWTEPENQDVARLSMVWLTQPQADHIKRTLLAYKPFTPTDDGDPARDRTSYTDGIGREPGVED